MSSLLSKLMGRSNGSGVVAFSVSKKKLPHADGEKTSRKRKYSTASQEWLNFCSAQTKPTVASQDYDSATRTLAVMESEGEIKKRRKKKTGANLGPNESITHIYWCFLCAGLVWYNDSMIRLGSICCVQCGAYENYIIRENNEMRTK